jgi:uncharacterized protein
MFMHASHNIFFQEVFAGLTAATVPNSYLLDEFGAISAGVAILVALIFWSKRGQLKA